MAVECEGKFAHTYNVMTFGGLNQKNVADVIDWWRAMPGVSNS